MARSGRQDRNRKLRAAFISQTAGQLRELAALLDAGGNGLEEAVAGELDAVAERATALQLEPIAAASTAAATRVREGTSEWSLRPVLHALETAGLVRAFPPLVVVAPPEHLGGLKERAAAACEPLLFLTSTEALGRAMQCDAIQGVLLPQSSIHEVPTLREALGAPIYIYGRGHAGARLDAARAGAAGWVDEPLPLDLVLRRQRQDTWQRVLGRPRVLVLADDSESRGLTRLLEQSDQAPMVRAISDPVDFLAPFAEVGPALVVLGETTGGVDAQHTVNLLRTHPQGAHVPVLVLGAPDWASSYPHVQCYGNAASLAESALMVLALTHTEASSTDLVTGVQARPVVLEALDREMARSRRSQRPVTVIAIGVDQLASVEEAYGAGAVDRGLRIAAETLSSGFRLYDLVGRVTRDAFLVCLPDCAELAARARVEQLKNRFVEAVALDPELSTLSWSVGITDSERGPAQLLRRLDDALEEARARA